VRVSPRSAYFSLMGAGSSTASKPKGRLRTRPCRVLGLRLKSSRHMGTRYTHGTRHGTRHGIYGTYGMVRAAALQSRQKNQTDVVLTPWPCPLLLTSLTLLPLATTVDKGLVRSLSGSGSRRRVRDLCSELRANNPARGTRDERVRGGTGGWGLLCSTMAVETLSLMRAHEGSRGAEG
jgi:hypothetical protein